MGVEGREESKAFGPCCEVDTGVSVSRLRLFRVKSTSLLRMVPRRRRFDFCDSSGVGEATETISSKA